MSHAYLNKLAAEAGVTRQFRETPLLTYHAYVDKDGKELGSDDVIDIALEHLVQKAGKVMREQCVEACHKYDNRIEAMRDCEYQAELAGRQAGAMRLAAAIRALPSVTLEDLK